ncbi:hypothetical protein T4B_4062 [Trichinella pseudospiralis]|uniref:Uncharacterized protein n=1 Tax=Trichinella pseudospiralis TaxID=6337 RepID=A0A0V1JSR5_TRIPS|nr:hypothetical protein T4A_9082 [Trichinella pseudospiralis]KRZ34812.1 hypothetical protein T4B_4062 [Trichinella pseudospiralis]KRZ38011.1 hypothetical protein T4C_14137 [Trichinella pseudospiralis]
MNIFAPAHTDAYVDFQTAMKNMNGEKNEDATEAPKSGSEAKIHNSDVLSFLNTLVMDNQAICPNQDKYTEHIVQCPSSSPRGIADKVCITTSELCNGIKSCPNAEDENPALCMFWLSTMDYVRQFTKTVTMIIEPMILEGVTLPPDPKALRVWTNQRLLADVA